MGQDSLSTQSWANIWTGPSQICDTPPLWHCITITQNQEFVPRNHLGANRTRFNVHAVLSFNATNNVRRSPRYGKAKAVYLKPFLCSLMKDLPIVEYIILSPPLWRNCLFLIMIYCIWNSLQKSCSRKSNQKKLMVCSLVVASSCMKQKVTTILLSIFCLKKSNQKKLMELWSIPCVRKCSVFVYQKTERYVLSFIFQLVKRRLKQTNQRSGNDIEA